MYLIDTNVHAAFILQNYETDTITKQAISSLNQITLSQRIITAFILNELETILVRVAPAKYGLTQQEKNQLKTTTLDYINRIIEKCTLNETTSRIIKQANELYNKYQQDHYISFTDSLLLATAKTNNYTLFTLDDRLNKKAKQEKIHTL